MNIEEMEKTQDAQEGFTNSRFSGHFARVMFTHFINKFVTIFLLGRKK